MCTKMAASVKMQPLFHANEKEDLTPEKFVLRKVTALPHAGPNLFES